MLKSAVHFKACLVCRQMENADLKFRHERGRGGGEKRKERRDKGEKMSARLESDSSVQVEAVETSGSG